MRKDILITGKRGFIGKQIRGGKEFLGRIENRDHVRLQVNGVSGIVHLAAKSDWRIAEADPKACILTNLVGLCNVLEAALENDLWILFVSSFQVKERTLYGLSKLMGEELCRLYAKRGLKVRILRLPVVYGPGGKKSKLVSKLIDELERGITPKIETKKKFYFAYVQDVSRLIEREANLLDFRPGRKITLTKLAQGIKQCLSRKTIMR